MAERQSAAPAADHRSAAGARASRSLRERAGDIGLVLAVTTFTLYVSGAQVWTGVNSPDSEFSASLVIFGNKVTERAIDPAYYWTRLGFLAPMHGLTNLLGFWTAWEVWRTLLLLLAAGATFWIARRRTNRLIATAAALFVALNTMWLAYLGNPYATGTAMAATFALLATAVATLDGPRTTGSARLLPGLLAGALVAWLVMTNPYAALLGLVLWLGVRAIALIADRNRWRDLIVDAVTAVIGFAITFGVFLAAGAAMFPGDNWFDTYRQWNSRLDYASFISDPMIWRRDAALAVIAIALVTAVTALLAARSRFTAAAAIIITATIAFTLGYLEFIPGPWLEAPHYAAMLWPPALVAITMAVAVLVGNRTAPAWSWLTLIPLAALPIWAGHRGERATAMQVVIAIVVCAIAVVITAAVSRSASSTATVLLAIASLAVIGVASQVLQNGRGQLGIYGQYPMNAAFVDYDAETLMRSKVQAQVFVLANTSKTDRVGIWTDPDRKTSAIAAMQLWGKYNNVTANAVLDRAELKAFEQLRPTVIAMYAPDRAQIEQFAASLPPTARPQPLACTSVPYLGIGSPEAHVCVVRLNWVG